MTISTSAGSSAGLVTIRFSLPAEQPEGPVSVVGSFNNWTPGVHTLEPADDGTIAVTVEVFAGTDVHFRYLGSGGHWFNDPDADETTQHGCVIHVAPAELSSPPAPAPADLPTPPAPKRRRATPAKPATGVADA